MSADGGSGAGSSPKQEGPDAAVRPAGMVPLEKISATLERIEKLLAGTGALPTDRLWDASETARYLGMSESWIYKQVQVELIPFIAHGRVVRFDPESIKNWFRGEHGGKVLGMRRR
jgi:predicted DNA-binding transcriptional regulator AlpA